MTTTKLFSHITIVAALIVGSLNVCAETLTADFNGDELPTGWATQGSNINHNDDRGRTGKSVWSNGKSDTDDYLITEAIEGSLTFYWRTYNASSTSSNGRVTVYEYASAKLGNVIQQTSFQKTTSWMQETVDLGSYRGRVAIALNYACIDDVTYTPYVASTDADLVIQNYPNGSTFDFGTVAAGTTQSFTLGNAGQSDLTISSISVTGGFTITSGASLTSIAAGRRSTIAIATPDQDAEGVLTIESNDPKGAYVVNLKSTLKIPAPVMVVSPAEVVFGLVEADAVRDIIVRNTGDAELLATIASDNAEFTTDKTTLTVAAGAQETFTVTYHYDATAFGGHSANITLTPNSGDAAVVGVSAYVKNPNAWTEDFSGNTLPDGWTQVGSAWTFANGEAQGSYERNGWLVTPKLKVKKGDQLTFQARSDRYGTDLIVQYQKNDGEWTTKLTKSYDGATEYETITISGLDAGTYRLRFASENLYLDNFEGFQLASAAAVKETWYVAYVFSYKEDGEEKSDVDTEPMEVQIDGDDIAFKFPEPINGGTWMSGTVNSDGDIVFPSGQYVGTYGGYTLYFCGSTDATDVADTMTFYLSDDGESYLCPALLLNTSATVFNPLGIFANVIVSKTEITDGIRPVPVRHPSAGGSAVYNLSGQQVGSSYRGIVIRNGKKVVQ